MSKETYSVKAIPSSFVFGDMKLLADKGAGEAKLFVGPMSKSVDIDAFFEFDNGWTYTFEKKNMLEYLFQVKMEFVFQKINQYKSANIEKWNELYSSISGLTEDQFTIHLKKFTDSSRYYVRADEDLFKKIFRKMVIPKLTDLLFVKDTEEHTICLLLQVNYNFENSEDDLETDIEAKNRRLFRYWLELQVKPEGDSDAGQPYSKATMDQYISNISNTSLASLPEKSVFYTTDAEEVMLTFEQISSEELKNHTQGSALKKYAEYLKSIVSEEDCNEVFEYGLYGIHIKEQNDALSESRPHVCIGWSCLGDLSSVVSREALAQRYDEYFTEKTSIGRGIDLGQIWRFKNDIQIGDYIIFAESSVFHIGRIETDYIFDETDYPDQSDDYKNVRKVRWLKKNIERSILSSDLHNSLKTAMSIWGLNDYKSAVYDLLRGTYHKDERIEEETEMSLNFKTALKSDYERNRIVFGAPGTGKSFELKKDSEEFVAGTSGTMERVTFHPDYTYAQFVGTYKPVSEGGSIRYEFVPGPFMRVFVDAIKSGRTEEPQPHILIIEEINRAKVAAVFGDVFQLLDRDDDGVSEYEIQTSEDIRKFLAKELGGKVEDYSRIRIPNNMFIWATMNSADQGVFPMDTAFKRRWNFEYLGINENESKIRGRLMLGTDIVQDDVEWNVLRKAINEKLAKEYKVNEDKLMGPFFLSKKALKTISETDDTIADTDKFIEVFKSKVIMYLYEDAAKQHKHKLFAGCKDTTKYSAVCEEFDRIGMQIFGEDFEEVYYIPQKG